MDIGAILKRSLTARHEAKLSVSAPQAAHTSIATRVTLSKGAHEVADAAAAGIPRADEPTAASELRDLLSAYDFHNISPRQMANLAGVLIERHELSREMASSFIGTEKNLVAEMDEHKAIDLHAHYERMLSVAVEARVSDESLDYAVEHRQLATQTLQDLMSFVASNRDHISS